MRRLFKNSLALSLVLFVSSQSYAADLCQRAFLLDPFAKQAMTQEMSKMAAKSVASLRSSATSARIENKWTVNRGQIESMIQTLAHQLAGEKIEVKARDTITDGYRNVTHTVYLEKFELNLEDSGMPVAGNFPRTSVSFKTRIRKYAETLALKENTANKESVQAMLEFIRMAHENRSSFAPLAINLYERISYAIDFIDHSKQDTKFQIQMTLDKSIAFFVSSMGKTIEAYRPEDSVVEIKTPVEYADYTLASDLRPVAGYRVFLQFIEKVKKAHRWDYMAGVGKMGHGHRQYLLETAPQY